MSTIPSAELRADVHAVLDDIWLNAAQTGGYKGEKRRQVLAGRAGNEVRRNARRRTYDWLSEQMWLRPGECHVRRFTEDQCFEAICLLHGTTYAEIRQWARQRERDRAYAECVERRLAA